MSWKRYMPSPDGQPRRLENLLDAFGGDADPASAWRYASYLPEIYAGQPQRLERYIQYEMMDLDSEINASLDTIAEFCTQTGDDRETPFEIFWTEEPSETDVAVVREALNEWVNINRLNHRIFRIVRNTLKYGDQFFIRSPRDGQWLWVDPSRVQAIIVNKATGNFPESYVVQGLDPNLATQVATEPPPAYMQTIGIGTRVPGPITYTMARTPTQIAAGRYVGGQHMDQGPLAIPAKHMVHISLSEGLDSNWPFGTSILESVFKVYKQKELLEDSIIIYRVQRAPERRVFYIDVGQAPPRKAAAIVDRVRKEVHQRRIPNRTGGGMSIMDTAYNPLAIIEDYFFPQRSDGRGSRVEILPGGENLGQIDDLRYFDNKLKRALRIPTAYLPSGPEEGTHVFSDGRVGTAFIQEFRFTRYCRRLQMLLSPFFDRDFKRFLHERGIVVDTEMFELRMWPPQNFARYRQIEIDSAQLQVFQYVRDVPYLSKRFILKRYLDMTEEEILENERLLLEEQGEEPPEPEADERLPGGFATPLGPEPEPDFGMDRNFPPAPAATGVSPLRPETVSEPPPEEPSEPGGAV